jgi:hypothetical protein
MHKAGYHLADDVQFGVGPDGRATIFDTGSVKKLPAKRPEDDIRHDFDNLKRLAGKHDVPFVHPDHRNAAGEYEAAVDAAGKAGLSKLDALKLRNRLKRLRGILAETDPDYHDLTADEHAGLDSKLADIAQGKTPSAEFGVGDTLHYTGKIGTMPAEFRGYHTDPSTGEKMARVIVRPDSGPPFEASVKPGELSSKRPEPSPAVDPFVHAAADHAPAVAAVPPNSLGWVAGHQVRNLGGGKFQVETGKAYKTGTAAEVAGHIRDAWRHASGERAAVLKALDRAAGFEEPDWFGGGKAAGEVARRRAAVPEGARGVSLEPNTRGRVGRVVRDPETGAAHLLLDGGAEVKATDFEPLESRHSWRVPEADRPAAPRAKQGDLFNPKADRE